MADSDDDHADITNDTIGDDDGDRKSLEQVSQLLGLFYALIWGISFGVYALFVSIRRGERDRVENSLIKVYCELLYTMKVERGGVGYGFVTIPTRLPLPP